MWLKKNFFLNNCNAGIVLQAAPAVSNLKGSEGGRGASWLHRCVVHKDFINSSAFQRGGWEMKSTAFRLMDTAVFFFKVSFK